MNYHNAIIILLLLTTLVVTVYFASTSAGQEINSLRVFKKSFRVFVTNESFTGDVEGLNGADRICARLASDAGLNGRWMAWLSDSRISAAQRFFHSRKPYVLVTGEIVAYNWDDLTTMKEDESFLRRPIDKNQLGQTIPTSNVMTGTVPNGDKFSSDLRLSCMDYQEDACDAPGTFCHTPFGTSDEVDPSWTFTEQEGCNEHYHLYCFEQP